MLQPWPEDVLPTKAAGTHEAARGSVQRSSEGPEQPHGVRCFLQQYTFWRWPEHDDGRPSSRGSVALPPPPLIERDPDVQKESPERWLFRLGRLCEAAGVREVGGGNLCEVGSAGLLAHLLVLEALLVATTALLWLFFVLWKEHRLDLPPFPFFECVLFFDCCC